MTNGGVLWLLILAGANGALLGLQLAYIARRHVLVAELQEAKENAVREFARWRMLADAAAATELSHK